MKKFIVYIAAIILILCFAVVPVFATGTESEYEKIKEAEEVENMPI